MKTAEETILKLCEQVDHWKGQAEYYKGLYEGVGTTGTYVPIEQLEKTKEFLESAPKFRYSQMNWNEQELKQKYSDEDWAEVPKEVMWLCTDSFGNVEMWVCKPSVDINVWVNDVKKNNEGYEGDLINLTPYAGDWKDSLEERPQHLR